jgi:phosphatidylserine decarboxylase
MVRPFMNSILSSIAKVVPPVNKEGYPFIAIAAVVTAALALVSTSLFWIGFGLTLWVVLFFRDPVRVTPDHPDLVISPADGVISQVGIVAAPPELFLPDDRYLRVSIFMNVFNCHVNRSPMAGRIERIAYTPGKFFNAELDKASEHNERNGLVISGPVHRIAVVQIAGLVARRIVCWRAQGDELRPGERFGMIRFGSRLDVYMPAGTVPSVAAGQTAVAGETIIADLSAVGDAAMLVRVG